MSFGTKVTNVNIHSGQYADAHSMSDCNGTFGLTFRKNGVLDSTGLGPIRISAIPMVSCPVCRASYVAPGFEDWIETMIAESLILSPGLLTKPQLRFLRQSFDYTQAELANLIGVADKHEIAKMESPNSVRTMDPDKQLRLKLIYAGRLDLKEVEKLISLALPNDQWASVDLSFLKEADIRQMFSAEKLRA